MSDMPDREMTLQEWCDTLHKNHLVNKELQSLQSQRDRWLAKHAREVKSLQQKLKEVERERDSNEESLTMLFGQKFSDRHYQALKSRADQAAEREKELLIDLERMMDLQTKAEQKLARVMEMLRKMLQGYEADCSTRNVEPTDTMANHTWIALAYKEAQQYIKFSISNRIDRVMQAAYNKGLEDAAEIADNYPDKNGVGPRISKEIRKKIIGEELDDNL